MKKSSALSFSLVLLMLGSITTVEASRITFSGQILASSCQIIPSSPNITVDTSDTGTLKTTGDKGQVRPFSIALDRCSGTMPTGKNAYIKINGATLAGQPTMFNKSPADATNAGIFVASATTPTVPLGNGDKSIQFTTNAQGGQVNLVAGLIAAGATTAGTVTAPIDFTFDLH